MGGKSNKIAAQYGAHTTAEDIAKNYDLRGKNAIVTGGYSGMSAGFTTFSNSECAIRSWN